MKLAEVYNKFMTAIQFLTVYVLYFPEKMYIARKLFSTFLFYFETQKLQNLPCLTSGGFLSNLTREERNPTLILYYSLPIVPILL